MIRHTQDVHYRFQIFKTKSNFKINVLHFIGYQEISQDCEFIIWVSINTTLEDLENFLGCSASIIIESHHDTSFLNGIIDQIECYQQSQTDGSELNLHLKITLRSILSSMKRSKRFTVYQNLTKQEIIRELLNKYALSFKTTGLQEDHEKYEFYNQYDKSDYAFFKQILSDLNSHFIILHDFSEHTLLLEDNQSLKPKNNQQKYQINYTLSGQDLELNQIYNLHMVFKNTLISSTAISYNYKNPPSILKSFYPSHQNRVDYQAYPTNTLNHEETDRFAKNMLMAKETESMHFEFLSTITNLKLGDVIPITKSQNNPVERELFVYKILHFYSSYKGDISGEAKTYLKKHGLENKIESLLNLKTPSFNFVHAISNDKPYVTTLYKQKDHNLPPIPARVVSYNEQPISIDEKGRIPIQFFWQTGSYSTTCWVPLAQNLIGRSWGTMAIPRAGMDVLVHFMHGDINRPIITGCIHNDENHLSTEQITQPWSLSYQSHSQSSPQNSHFIAISDQANNEKIYVKSGKNLECKINHSLLFDIENEANINIKKGNGKICLAGENSSFKIQVGSTYIDVQNENISIYSDSNINILSKNEIKLTSEQSIKIESPNIHLNASTLKITSQTLDIKTQTSSFYASQIIDIQAGIKVTLDFPGKTQLFPLS